MWMSEEAMMTPLHKKLYKVSKRIQQGTTPLYSVVFNFIDDRFYSHFASACGNEINVCKCLEDGDIATLQSYGDEDAEESFYTVSWARSVEGNSFVVAGGLKRIIRVLNVTYETVHKTLVGHEGSVNEIRTHPVTPQLVLSASKDGSVRLWNIETGICVVIFPGSGGDRSEVLSVDFHPHDEHRFVSCGMDNTIKIWSFKDFWTYVEDSFTWKDDPSNFPTQVVQFPVFTAPSVRPSIPGFPSIPSSLLNCNRWFDDHSILSKSGVDGEILLWEPKIKENSPGEGAIYGILSYPIPDSNRPFIKFSCDLSMNFVSIGNSKGKIYVWNLKIYPPVLVTVLSHCKSKSVIRQTAMSVDGTTILATSEDGTLWRWDVKRV